MIAALASAAPAFAVSGDPMKLENDDSSWVMPAKNYEGTRYSPLKEIDKSNVSQLKVAWTFSTGLPKGHEAAPLVVDKTMYLVTPYPNKLIALDLTKPGAPAKWVYEPMPEPAAQGVACCDVVNRGASYYDGRIYYNTLDDQTVAVDAKTGKLAWKTKLGDIEKGETITMAPIVVKGKVIVGNSGGEMGVRGWVTALDAGTGKIAWRAYSTGPDKDVLIGSAFKPHYESEKGKDLGVQTWPPDKWRIGGGTVWGWVTYDPKLDLLYYGTANPGPWNPAERPGDNKWTCGVFARRPSDGQAVWFYQTAWHDLFDHDSINESVLADLVIDGKKRQVAIHPGRTGYMYVLDRTDGEVISAAPYERVTVYKGVDLKTGRIIPVPGKEVGTGKMTREICPASPGAKDWPPSALDPNTGVLYVPANNFCQDEEGTEVGYIAGTPYVGANVRMYAGPGGHRGELVGWDVAHSSAVFRVPEKFPMWSGVLVTGGGVVFYGTMDGWFKAVDSKSGKELWKFKTGSGIIGQPITFKGPDGKQYVSIFSGIGGWPGVMVNMDLDPADKTAALGFSGVVGDLKEATTPGGMLYTFALP